MNIFPPPSVVISTPSASYPPPKRAPSWDLSCPAVTPRSPSPDEERKTETSPHLGSIPPPWRHERYYITDELLVFKVENELFRVHKLFFERESNIFNGMFDMDSSEGRTDEMPIVLPEVTVFEFECLLDFIYYRMQTRPDTPTIAQWTGLLSISTRFMFDNIRERAISKLTRLPVDPVERIVIAKRYNVPGWLIPAYTDLCQCPELLEADQAKRLDLEEVITIGKLRERLLKDRNARPLGRPELDGKIVLSRPTTPIWDESKTTSWTKLTATPRFDETVVRTMVASAFNLAA